MNNEIGENQGNVQSTNHLHRLSELGWSGRNWWGRETADTTDSLTSDSAILCDSGSLFFTTSIGLPACSNTSGVQRPSEKCALKPPASLPRQETITSHFISFRTSSPHRSSQAKHVRKGLGSNQQACSLNHIYIFLSPTLYTLGFTSLTCKSYCTRVRPRQRPLREDCNFLIGL